MKPSRVMVTTIWPGSIRLSSSWSATASTIAVMRGRRQFRARRHQLAAHHLHAADVRAENVEQIADPRRRPRPVLLDLVALEPGQALQTQFEDAARLRFRQAHRAPRLMTLPGSSISASSTPISAAGQSRSISAARAVGGVGARADQADHLVDIVDRDREADQQMCARSRAFASSKRLRRRITSSRNAMKRQQRVASGPSAAAGRRRAPACSRRS